MNCRTVQEDIATALLTGGELDPQVAEHVALCPACAAEQASLRQVTAVLSMASIADVEAPAGPPANDLLLHRILAAAAVEREQERRRLRVGRILLAAAAALLLVAGITLGTVVFRSNDVISASASTSSLSATVDIAKAEAGSELRVAVTGLVDDTDCIISVHTRDGRTIPVVQWRAEYEGTAHVTGMVAAAPDSITKVSLTEPNGNVLLTIPVSA